MRPNPSQQFCAMFDRCRLHHGGTGIAARIAVTASIGNSVAEYLAAMALDPPSHFDRPARSIFRSASNISRGVISATSNFPTAGNLRTDNRALDASNLTTTGLGCKRSKWDAMGQPTHHATVLLNFPETLGPCWIPPGPRPGRGSRIRTRDPRFWRPMLYQLSYTPRPECAPSPIEPRGQARSAGMTACLSGHG